MRCEVSAHSEWVVESYLRDDDEPHGGSVIEINSIDGCVARMKGGTIEDARKMAAAPELLEALKGLMNPPLDHTYCFSESCGECQECAARAAIAKADGKS